MTIDDKDDVFEYYATIVRFFRGFHASEKTNIVYFVSHKIATNELQYGERIAWHEKFPTFRDIQIFEDTPLMIPNFFFFLSNARRKGKVGTKFAGLNYALFKIPRTFPHKSTND